MDRFEAFVQFITELGKFMTRDKRIMFCQVPGDPGEADKKHWVAKPLSREQIRDTLNVFVCVSLMGRNERGEFRRRKDNFGGGCCLMIDDVGNGKGSKAPLSILNALKPTALVETSPQNYQAVYMFDRLIDDPDYFDRMINGFIARNLMAKDTGMAGINRVFRPPFGINGKRKYFDSDGKPHVVRLDGADYSLRYAQQQIIDAFGIPMKVTKPLKTESEEKLGSQEVNRREASFNLIKKEFKLSGSVLRETDYGGWTDVLCPWADEHTQDAQRNSGAALRQPNQDNNFLGAFHCWHGSCKGDGGHRRGLADVIALMARDSPRFSAELRRLETEWDDQDAAELDRFNSQNWMEDVS